MVRVLSNSYKFCLSMLLLSYSFIFISASEMTRPQSLGSASSGIYLPGSCWRQAPATARRSSSTGVFTSTQSTRCSMYRPSMTRPSEARWVRATFCTVTRSNVPGRRRNVYINVIWPNSPVVALNSNNQQSLCIYTPLPLPSVTQNLLQQTRREKTEF